MSSYNFNIKVERIIGISITAGLGGLLVLFIGFESYIKSGPYLKFRDWDLVEVMDNSFKAEFEVDNLGERSAVNGKISVFYIVEKDDILHSCQRNSQLARVEPMTTFVLEGGEIVTPLKLPSFIVIKGSYEDEGLFGGIKRRFPIVFDTLYFNFEQVKAKKSSLLAGSEIINKIEKSLEKAPECEMYRA